MLNKAYSTFQDDYVVPVSEIENDMYQVRPPTSVSYNLCSIHDARINFISTPDHHFMVDIRWRSTMDPRHPSRTSRFS